MKLDEEAARVLRELRDADGASFSDLVRIAGLDPARDLRGTNLSNVSFHGSDLTGYDFTDADLRGASFLGAWGAEVIFDRALIDRVLWPAEGFLARRWRAQVRAFPLRPRQQEIANALLKAFEPRRARALALLPSGVGKTTILVEVLGQLQRRKVFRSAAVLCATLAERDQVAEVLNERGIPTDNDRTVRNREKLRRGYTLVSTVSAYAAVRGDDRLTAAERLNALGVSHIVLLSLPASPSARQIADLSAELDQASVLGFGDFGLDEKSAAAWLERGGMLGKFGIAYRYDALQALDDGILTRSEVIDRSHVGAGAKVDAKQAAQEMSTAEEVASDFRMEFDLRSAMPALVLAPDVEAAEQLAKNLEFWFTRAFDVDDRRPSVVVLSGRSDSDVRARMPRNDTVAVVTPAFAEAISLNSFRLVGVLAPLSARLDGRLVLPPAAGREGSLRVLDYRGAVARLAESFK